MGTAAWDATVPKSSSSHLQGHCEMSFPSGAAIRPIGLIRTIRIPFGMASIQRTRTADRGVGPCALLIADR